MVKVYFYQENEVRSFSGKGGYRDLKATQIWLKHFENSLYLQFFAQHETDFAQKRSLLRELSVAERKMEYWKKHPNWDMQQATMGADKLKKHWQTPGEAVA